MRAILRIDMVGGGTANGGVTDPDGDANLATPPWIYGDTAFIGGDLLSTGPNNGWMDLSNAIDISADGSTILGYGHNAAGDYAPFIATIPEPGTMVLLSAGALLRRR